MRMWCDNCCSDGLPYRDGVLPCAVPGASKYIWVPRGVRTAESGCAERHAVLGAVRGRAAMAEKPSLSWMCCSARMQSSTWSHCGGGRRKQQRGRSFRGSGSAAGSSVVIMVAAARTPGWHGRKRDGAGGVSPAAHLLVHQIVDGEERRLRHPQLCDVLAESGDVRQCPVELIDAAFAPNLLHGPGLHRVEEVAQEDAVGERGDEHLSNRPSAVQQTSAHFGESAALHI